MNKDTARLIKNIKQFPGNAVVSAGHNLGIAAKPVEKTTTREYMDLAKDEREAKSLYSSTLLNVNMAVSNRMHVQKMKNQLDEVQASQEAMEDHYKAMEELGKRAASMMHIEDIVGEFEQVREEVNSINSTTREGDETSKEDTGDKR